MPDISMCKNKQCSLFEHCYRAQAKPDPYRQAYGSFSPDENGYCKYFDAMDEDQCPSCGYDGTFSSGDLCDDWHENKSCLKCGWKFGHLLLDISTSKNSRNK